MINQIQVHKVPFGIACRIGNDIFINKNLEKQDIHLYHNILQHEKEHSNFYTLNDLKMDIKNKHLKGFRKRYYKFILRNPASLVEFLPFWVYEHQLIINPSVLCIYGVILTLTGGILWILA